MTPLPVVVVIGLGPADADLLSTGALDAIAAHAPAARWARTERHPAVGALGEHCSFDEIYDAATRIDAVYPAIVERLVTLAADHGSVLYAVPGSPLVAERTVELLRAEERVRVVVHPALSFLDLVWDRLGIDPLAAGVRLVDGHRFEVDAAGERGPLLVGQCDALDVLSTIKLAVDPAPAGEVVVLQRLGLPDESVTRIAWNDLDRRIVPDHLTSVYVPELAAPVGAELLRFEGLVRSLRERCPWDRQQTHASLRPYLVEEAYEVIDAIGQLDDDSGAGYEELEEELGDLLFQVYIHAAIAAEAGWFTLADVARGIHDKLYRRHPHVFGDVQVDGPDAVVTNWDAIKRAEKGRSSTFDGIPETFPARLFAAKVAKRAAKIGFTVDFAEQEAVLDSAEEALRAAAIRAVAEGRRRE